MRSIYVNHLHYNAGGNVWLVNGERTKQYNFD